MDTTTVNLIRVDDAINTTSVPDCRVDYRPAKKYRVEIPNAFDPSILHRRGPWYEDSIDVTFIIAPESWPELHTFLAAPGQLYIEFSIPENRVGQGDPGWRVLQLPVVCTALPPLFDVLREFTGETSASFLARYSTPPDAIDWDTYEIPDGLEEIFP